jgi:hypothetical protein
LPGHKGSDDDGGDNYGDDAHDAFFFASPVVLEAFAKQAHKASST